MWCYDSSVTNTDSSVDTTICTMVCVHSCRVSPRCYNILSHVKIAVQVNRLDYLPTRLVYLPRVLDPANAFEMVSNQVSIYWPQ